ncbi:GmrSD restriction endonuclease domain-containing protein [Bradyrhizobium sp. SYSU BS000235]|uniref:GmrSD restriction endonuclease domain-containing protein n=1 Tax=Bradyrhizobium sp. SYSU BS000235 TaxID=3411332 RepID=UPI003C72737A
MLEEVQIEFEAPLEKDEDTLDISDEQRAVHTDKLDSPVESLHRKFKQGKLTVQPDFQRDFVWDPVRASRLIESALLSIPIPTIYTSIEPDGKEYVIDGQQRLTSFFSFIDGKFPDGNEFKLRGLKVFQELNDKYYEDLLESQQSTINDFTLRVITFKRGSDENLKFEIFERLNTGSVPLNDQELRNCIYRGSYNVLVRELAEYSEFRQIMGLAKPDKRRKDEELVLRFCAFYNATYLNYKPPMKAFLNNEASKRRNLSIEAADEIRDAFKKACQVTRSMFGEHAFKRFYRGTEKHPDGYWEPKKFNASLFDVVMYTFAREDKNILQQNLDSIREALICLMTENGEFINSIELSTSSYKAVTKRFDLWRNALEKVIGVGRREPRCFSRKLKDELFKKDPTCSLCNQRIADVDDSAVDHIEQYWTGGKTIDENARLTHRYCNCARSRNDKPTVAAG